MAALRATLPTTRCTVCQRSILNAFTQPTILPCRQSRQVPRPLSRRPIARTLYSSAARRSEVVPQNEVQELSRPPPLQEQHDQDEEHTDADPQASKDTTKPWYLQLQDQQQVDEPNPFAHRQKLPDIPPNPPPLLPSLLNHLSIDIGLDHLSILDLRHVDPPPAFGSNLLMLFGTARSEKHLNVSADRFCRWLRTKHQLTPYADGLLGRNELKLKMRRKARRSKMMQAVGAGDSGVPDDGTRTGWVCVNVGAVDGNATDEAGSADVREDGFIGFGRRSEGAKIVVQMMTEEKRGELDLENLWQGVLRGSIKRQKALEEGETDVHRPLLLAKDPDARRRHFLAGLERREQVRGFHSSARKSSADVVTDGRPRPMSNTDENLIAMLDGKDTAPKTTASPFPDAKSASALEAHLTHLESLPRVAALEAVGSGHTDKSSTPFLKAFYSSMPLFPIAEHYIIHLRLHEHALRLEHSGYTKQAFYDLLLDMEVSCPTVPYEAFTLVIDTILDSPHTLPAPLTEANPFLSPSPFPRKPLHPELVPPPSTNPRDVHVYPLTPTNSYKIPPPNTSHVAVLHTITLATSVLERLPAHGHPALPPTFLHDLNKCISFPRFPESYPHIYLDPRSRETLQHHLRQCVTLLHSHPSATNPNTVIPDNVPEDLLVSLLDSNAKTGNWQGFWNTWRAMALRMQPRNAAMYAILFEEVAKTKQQGMIGRVVSEWVPEMGREVPRVEMDARVARGVMECLRVLGREEGELWDRCLEVLERRDGTLLTLGPEGGASV